MLTDIVLFLISTIILFCLWTIYPLLWIKLLPLWLSFLVHFVLQLSDQRVTQLHGWLFTDEAVFLFACILQRVVSCVNLFGLTARLNTNHVLMKSVLQLLAVSNCISIKPHHFSLEPVSQICGRGCGYGETVFILTKLMQITS